ncbi:acyl-CoA dehydrogenase, partial [Roseateles toxinivorans]
LRQTITGNSPIKPSRWRSDLNQMASTNPGAIQCLQGEKCVVIGGDTATAFIVSAQAPGGLCLFWVEAESVGLTRHSYPLVDGGRGANLTLFNVYVGDDARLCEPGFALDLLNHSNQVGLAALGAEAIGLVDLLLAQTLAYTRERRQFGQTLAQFQVLRHRMVDMFMQAEQLRSMVLLANIRLAESRADVSRVLSGLKVQVGKVGRFVGQQAIQLHGGMGMSDEVVVGHAFKRLLALDAQLGNVDHHLRHFAAQSQVA